MDNKEKSPEQELIESIGLMIGKGVESSTNIYTGVVKGVDGKRAVVTVNGRDQNVAIATADVSSGNVVKVFVPSNNMSAAFIIKAESSGGGSGTTTNYGDLTNKPSINGNTLIGNKTSAQIGVYGSDNPPPYPVTSVNSQTGDVTIEAGGNVDSVNGKTGTVVLDKSDIGLGNVDNVKQYSASNPPPYPVKSVDGVTGAVTTNAVKTTAQSLTNAQKTQARTNIGAGTSSFSGSYNDLTDKPTIPDPYTLPVANSTTLGGVKPVAKTSDMTQSVGVDANGALYTAPGGGGTGSGDMLKSVYDPNGTVEAAGGIPDYVEENGGKIDTIKVNGTAQVISNKTVNITVPTKTSDITNDSGYLTSVPVTSVNSKTGAVQLNASDVGALPNTTVIPSKTSQLNNDSGFITDIPIASTTQLGGVKIGAGLSVSENGTLSVTGGGTADAVEWNNVLDKPTTIAGYGITDAKIDNDTITLGDKTITPLTSAPVTSVNGQTGDVTVREVPAVTTADNGKFLRVINGAWAAVAIADANGVSF